MIQDEDPALTISDPASGLRLIARAQRPSPVVSVLLPGQASHHRGIEIEVPEHAWGRLPGADAVVRLYQGALGDATHPQVASWRRSGQGLEYRLPLLHQVTLAARIELESDGARISYVLSNDREQGYQEVQAVTCVQLHDTFSDQRLERTYVHHADGFELLAAETPDRLLLPLERWLPCRYLIPFRAPPSSAATDCEGGVLRHHKSRPVDEPFIATVSHDGRWIAATCTRETGNVWTNPERTCQHADPAAALPARSQARLELKTFVVRSGLDAVLSLIRAERKAGPVGHRRPT